MEPWNSESQITAACFSALLNVERCKMVFSWGQQVFIIEHYFLTKLCNKVRKQSELQSPGVNLSSNKVICCVICNFENEYSVDEFLCSGQPTVASVEKEEEVRKHESFTTYLIQAPCSLCWFIAHFDSSRNVFFPLSVKDLCVTGIKAVGPWLVCSLLLTAFTKVLNQVYFSDEASFHLLHRLY